MAAASKVSITFFISAPCRYLSSPPGLAALTGFFLLCFSVLSFFSWFVPFPFFTSFPGGLNRREKNGNFYSAFSLNYLPFSVKPSCKFRLLVLCYPTYITAVNPGTFPLCRHGKSLFCGTFSYSGYRFFSAIFSAATIRMQACDRQT